MIRVLIVDDSNVMRALIRAQLEAASDMKIVGEASDPFEARAAIKALNPDVVTLDVEMPNMSGIEFLEKLMRLRPTPVVMCSTLTHNGAETAIRALELGAVDCVGKPTGAIGDFGGLVDKVRAAAVAKLRPSGDVPLSPPAPAARFTSNGNLVAIGSSTGGVEALIQLLTAFPAECPPTVITQHMPATFTKTFAARLDRLCTPAVEEAYDGARLERGRIYIAPGGDTHLRIEGRGGLHCRLDASAPVNGHRPSVDVMFHTLAECAGPAAIGVILTGMGRDGAAGLLAMRNRGARTLGQDEASCVVYGMPKAAFELGAVERQAPLSRLSSHILTLAGASSSAGA